MDTAGEPAVSQAWTDTVLVPVSASLTRKAVAPVLCRVTFCQEKGITLRPSSPSVPRDTA